MSYSPLLNNFRFFTLHSGLLKSYYDILGIPRNATQAEIKSAYYKLSMIYHPDRNQGSKEAAEKFQSISRAYEILGNFQRRRLYDKGLLIDRKTEAPHSTAQESAYQKQKPSATGRTPLYDFDEWSRAHYGQSFARRSSAKNEFKKEHESYSHRKRDHAMLIVLLFLLIVLIVGAAIQNDLDEPRKNDSPDRIYQDPKKTK